MALSTSDHRSQFCRVGNNSLTVAIVLLAGFSLIRFLLVLQASQSGNYQYTSFIFIVMLLLPWLLLNRAGRRSIGIREVTDGKGLWAGILLAALSAALIHYVMLVLFGDGMAHPFRYIGNTYQNLPPLNNDNRLIYFLIYTLISITFSPIGEELFYRGLVHEYLATRLGHTVASYLDSAAFALVHLAHFGIIYGDQIWKWLVWPSVCWVVLLFVSCRIFYKARQWSGSILGAVLAHGAFNLTMNYFIFFHLL